MGWDQGGKGWDCHDGDDECASCFLLSSTHHHHQWPLRKYVTFPSQNVTVEFVREGRISSCSFLVGWAMKCAGQEEGGRSTQQHLPSIGQT